MPDPVYMFHNNYPNIISLRSRVRYMSVDSSSASSGQMPS